MSTLESIRQRPVLIISILGLALLLFILTAVDNPGSLFTDSHTVAKVDGQKIDYMDFQRRVESQQEQLRQRGYENIDIAQVQEYVMNQMINETLMESEYERLGLTVTDRELSEAMLGNTPHPYVGQMLQSMGIPSAQMLYEAAYNPTKAGVDASQSAQLQQAWKELETNTEKVLLQQKFMSLFTGTLTANKLDAKAMFDDNATTSTIAFAKKDFSTLSNDEFPVTDEEINALYKEEKNRYRINEDQHVISYIAVDIVPSQADLAAAQSDVENALVALRTNPGTDGIASNGHFYVNRVNAPVYRLAPNLRKAVPEMAADSVAMVQFVDNEYTIVKMIGRTQSVDSVLLDLAFIADGAPADSVLSRLNAGATVEELGTENIANSQNEVWVSLLEPSLGALKDELAEAATGVYFQPTNNNGNTGMTLRIRERKPAVDIYDFAEITYDVIPSNATEQDLKNKLNEYLAANNTAETFSSEAVKAGYSALSAVVTPGSLSINGLDDSRGAAKWVLGAKKGEVSHVFLNDRSSRLLAVAVNDVYDGNFIPATNSEVRLYLTEKVRNRKKAEKLTAEYQGKGKTVAEYAAAMGVKVDTTQVTFGQPFVRNFPMFDSNLNANVAVAKPGQVVGPVALNSSVAVFEVVKVDNEGREFDYDNDKLVFNQREGASSFQRTLPDVLIGNKKIDNRIQKFYSER